MSSRKGFAYEREICKLLSLWWTSDERDDVFWRTQGSGGRASSRSKAGKRTRGQYGDVCATDPIGQPLMDLFTVELKRGYSKDTIAAMLDHPHSAKEQAYEGWIKKARKTYKAAGSRWWMLIHKRDLRNPTVWVPSAAVRTIGVHCNLAIEATIWLRRGARKPILMDVHGFQLVDFLKGTSPAFLKQVHEDWQNGK